MITTKLTDQGWLRLKRTYTDVNGQLRTATFLEKGPSGSRWILDCGSMVTIDYVEKTHYRNLNGKLYKYATNVYDPWSAAINIKDTWVK